MKKRDVLLYADYGSSYRFLVDLLPAEIDAANHRIRRVTAEDIRDGEALKTACLFVMPGGEERHHVKNLGEAGNNNLRRFVESGGQFLGLCAGAYYGAEKIEYHRGLADEVIAPRPLGFFEGVAIGSLCALGRPYDKTLASASATSISVGTGQRFRVFYHGGPFFRPHDSATKVMARYADLPDAPAAIIRSQVGTHGGSAILSGVHPEFSARHIETGFLVQKDDPDMNRVVRALRPDDRVRRMFWRGLLRHCGLDLAPVSSGHALATALPGSNSPGERQRVWMP